MGALSAFMSMCVPGTQGSQKNVTDPLELKLGMAMKFLGTKPRSSARPLLTPDPFLQLPGLKFDLPGITANQRNILHRFELKCKLLQGSWV